MIYDIFKVQCLECAGNLSPKLVHSKKVFQSVHDLEDFLWGLDEPENGQAKHFAWDGINFFEF